MAFEDIAPFLSPLDEYLDRTDVTEIMINDDRKVFIEIAGKLEYIGTALVSDENVEQAVKRAARINGDDIDENRPILDTTFPDGSRVSAIFRSCTSGSTILTIRKFRPNWYSLNELVYNGTMPLGVANYLRKAVIAKRSILISGSTGSGKTTVTKSLIDIIPEDERIAIIEDTREIAVTNSNVIRMVARREINNKKEVTIRDLVKASLRSRPNRIIIGEVRGAEAFDLLDALNTGHSGSISTIHANSTKHAIGRLASLAMRADVGIPYAAIQKDIEGLIDICMHVSRMPDGSRKVVAVNEKGCSMYEYQSINKQ